LDQQSGKLRDLATELSHTLSSGEKMSSSLNTTLTSFDGLMKRFGVGEPQTAAALAATNSAPFNILDYAHTAEQLASASRELDLVLKDLSAVLDSPGWTKRMQDVNTLSQQAAVHSKSILNHAFLLAAALVALVLAAACFYRLLFLRVQHKP